MVKKIRRRGSPGQTGEKIYGLLQKMGGSPARARLASLWRSWRAAMGDDLADLARPLGSRGSLLLVGADNAMAMQELVFYGGELVERANAFLGCPYFDHARVNLASGDAGPVALAEEEQKPKARPQQPLANGKYLEQMDMASPVARCYALFAAQKNKSA